jgi:hypothetical protein
MTSGRGKFSPTGQLAHARAQEATGECRLASGALGGEIDRERERVIWKQVELNLSIQEGYESTNTNEQHEWIVPAIVSGPSKALRARVVPRFQRYRGWRSARMWRAANENDICVPAHLKQTCE